MLRDADIFLISGFNSMRDQDALDERLFTLRRHMRQLPSHALVYYEDAAFHEPAFSRRVRNALLEVIDVYGLNEDEMQAHLGYQIDLLSVTEVEQALNSLRTLIPAPTLVVHTKYWSLVLGCRGDEYAEAVHSGMVMASAHYCYGDDFTDEQHGLIRSLPMRPGHGRLPLRSKSEWAQWFAAFLVSRSTLRTPPPSGWEMLSLAVSLPHFDKWREEPHGRNPASVQPPAGPLLPGRRKITDFRGEPPAGDRERRTGSHRQRRLLASNRSVSRSCPMAGL